MAGLPRKSLSRRSLLAGTAGLGAAALAGGLSGCGSQVHISSVPGQLVLWYWNRSADPRFLKQAAKRIPGTTNNTLRSDVIGGSFDTKLRTSLAGDAYIPDLTFINSNVSLYYPNEEMFLDLDELGAQKYKHLYFDWKWQLGVTPTNHFRFFPLDTGPTGFYYRADVMKKAKLPSEPAAVAEQIKTWDGYIEFGKKLKKNAGSFMEITGSVLFQQYINASPKRYFDKAGNPLYMEPHNTIRDAWEVAVRAIKAGITGNQQVGNDQNAAWTSGKTAGHIEAVWWAQILADTAPTTKGRWRIADQPVRPGNSGGSFVCMPRTCKDPEAGFAFMTWLNSPKNQAIAFNDIQLFPSCPDSFTSGIMKSDSTFFGDESPLKFFRKAAEQVPTSFISTYETQAAYFTDEIVNVESSGKDPERAWQDAVEQTNRTLRKRGVDV